MPKPTSFKLPSSFVSQLNEFTTGFLLVTVNELGQFEVYNQMNTPAIKLGLVKFLEALSAAMSSDADTALMEQLQITPDEDGEAEKGEEAEEAEEDEDPPFNTR